MNVLVIGSGAREHAIVWKLKHDPNVEKIYVARGNSGTSRIATNLNVMEDDVSGLIQAVSSFEIDVTFVGPEGPLAAGIVDQFNEIGLKIIGPQKGAAKLESSKAFSKKLMLENGISTSQAETFDSFEQATLYLKDCPIPIVIKADGLAAGKGVFVCDTREKANKALSDIMVDKIFGDAGKIVLVEQFLSGREVSVFAFTDGVSVSSLVAACDYKRAFDGDLGPNTGGMGSYSPPEFWTEDLAGSVSSEIIEPIVSALAKQGIPYKGILYAGLMLTEEGPQVIEFNCRLGDPETQAILPRLSSSLMEVAMATIDGTMKETLVDWSDESCVAVVLASSGYPGKYKVGYPIRGLDTRFSGTFLFESGTKSLYDGSSRETSVVTNGGRVLTVSSLGNSLEEARKKAYTDIENITFSGAQWRKDICKLLPD